MQASLEPGTKRQNDGFVLDGRNLPALFVVLIKGESTLLLAMTDQVRQF